jgi:hypothetical protein
VCDRLQASGRYGEFEVVVTDSRGSRRSVARCPSDFLTALLAESIVPKEPGATVLCDVRASRAVRDLVERAARHGRVDRVGHAFFKPRMRDSGAAFGDEVSGHYYFRDFSCADCGTIPALVVLELLSIERAKTSELLEPLRSRYFIAGEINSEVEDQEGKTEELVARYRTVTSAASTGSPSTTRTSTSMCGHRTPSHSCASTSNHASHASKWRRSGTRCWPDPGLSRQRRSPSLGLRDSLTASTAAMPLLARPRDHDHIACPGGNNSVVGITGRHQNRAERVRLVNSDLCDKPRVWREQLTGAHRELSRQPEAILVLAFDRAGHVIPARPALRGRRVGNVRDQQVYASV